MDKYCSNCGKELPANAKFCPNCGKALNSNSISNKKSDKVAEIHIDHKKEVEVASAWRRFFNFLIDYFVVYFISFVVLIFFVALAGSGFTSSGSYTITTYIVFFIVFIFYYFIFESTTGRTLGKLITGTKVVDINNNKPETGIIFNRTLCRFIPFDAFTFLTSRPAGWHDSISKTKVVRNTKNKV